MSETILNSVKEKLLLKEFNNRKSDAFGEIYNQYYIDFHLYASKLYTNTPILAEDVIHDVFISIWQNQNIVFTELLSLKAYIIISIKNKFKSHINHVKYERGYEKHLTFENNFTIDIIENNIYSNVEQMLNLLPNDCAKIIKLYLDGWKPDEIAQKLGKSPQTVYNKKQEAISILRQKLPKDKFYILLFLFYN